MQKPEFNKQKFIIKRKDLDIDFLINKELDDKSIISIKKLLDFIGQDQKIEDMYLTLTDCEPEIIHAVKNPEYKKHLIELAKYQIWEAEQKIKELESE